VELETFGAVTAAWYQREITIPRDWSRRSNTLYAEYLNSYAAVYIDGTKAGEMRYPAGEIDLTAACRPGSKHVLSMYVVAMPLKAVLLSFNDSASAREVEGKVDRKGLCGDVYLASSPAGPRIADVKIDTSVRRWQSLSTPRSMLSTPTRSTCSAHRSTTATVGDGLAPRDVSVSVPTPDVQPYG
jgi:hypothetical protein